MGINFAVQNSTNSHEGEREMEGDTREKRGRLSEKDRFNQMMSPNLESKGGWGGGLSADL